MYDWAYIKREILAIAIYTDFTNFITFYKILQKFYKILQNFTNFTFVNLD